MSWNNARNRLKLLITAGGNLTSNPNLAFLVWRFQFELGRKDYRLAGFGGGLLVFFPA